MERLAPTFLFVVVSASSYAEKLKNAGCQNSIQKLVLAPFLDATQYSRPFLRRLAPQRDKSFLDRINLDLSDDGLAELARQLPLTSGKLSTHISLMKDAKDSDPNVVLLGILTTGPKQMPAGYFAVKIKFEGDQLQSEIDGVYFDRNVVQVSGKAAAILKFLSASIYSVVPVQKETLKADYAGRYVWAKLGFKFHPTYWFKDVDGGPTIKLIELARNNFLRFLKVNGVEIGALRVRNKPIKSLDELATPIDFAEVQHRNEKLIRVSPLIGYRTFGPEEEMPIGKAFMLSDYIPQDGKPFVVSRARTKFAATALPYWNGYRDIPR